MSAPVADWAPYVSKAANLRGCVAAQGEVDEKVWKLCEKVRQGIPSVDRRASDDISSWDPTLCAWPRPLFSPKQLSARPASTVDDRDLTVSFIHQHESKNLSRSVAL